MTNQTGTHLANTIEAQVASLEEALAEAEKAASALLGRVKGLRKRAGAGELGTLAGLFDPLPRMAQQVEGALQSARDLVTYDTALALVDGSYLAELMAEAKTQGVTLIERDGRLTAFPLLLKLEPRMAGVRIGRKLERRLRPSLVVKLLQAAQRAEGFNAARFLSRLFAGYAYLAPVAQPGWKPDARGAGPVVPLNDIYAVLTLLPAAASDYTREEFGVDLLRLDRAPDTRTSLGHAFTLPASTGSKGRDRLTVYDERGAEHVFVGIRFTREAQIGA